MYEKVDKSKENKSRAVANSVVQGKNDEQSLGLVDNRPKAIAQKKLEGNGSRENQDIQLNPILHSKGCGCPSCNNQFVQRKISNHCTSITQLMNDSTVLQFSKCKYCGWEGGHAPGCTTESREKLTEKRKEEAEEKHDKSMDARTREGQSHIQHNGDAKGREKMYEKWKK